MPEKSSRGATSFRRWILVTVAVSALSSGCVERKFVINTPNQPGAQVYKNGRLVGTTPVDDSFLYYGDYDFTLVKDGYATTRVREKVDAPWWAYPPFDFFAENLWPGRIKDVRRLDYQLQPLPQVRVDELIGRGEELRSRGRGLPAPQAPRFPELEPGR